MIKADLDEIVFRTRNKVYGAYQLRRNFGRTIMLAFLFCGGTLTILLSSPVIMRMFGGDDNTVEVKKETEVVLAEAPALEEEKLTPPPDVPPPPPPQRETVQFTPPEVVKDEEATPEATITPPPDDDKQNVGTTDQEGTGEDGPTYNFDDAGKGTGEAAPVVEANPDPNKFVKVDAQPKPSNMDDYRKSLVYPELARSAGVSGKVVLKVLIDQNGVPISHIVQKSPHPSLADEAGKKVYSLRFSPALQNGKPIKFWVVVPVDFTL